MLRRWLASAAAAAIVLTGAEVAQSATLLSGLGGIAGYGSNRLYLNDDGSSCDTFGGGGSGAVDLTSAFPAGLVFFGMTYHSYCVNNNGNITFGGGLGTYTPSAFPVASLRMIAPWWGDVDTRNGSLSDGTHDAVYWDVRAGQATTTWHNVGYFATHDDMQNDFQLIMRQFAGCGVGAFDVEMRYHQCEWVAGDASGGSGGHGGTPAQAGFDGGDMVHFYALPGSLSESVVNLCTTSNVGEPGVWRFRIRGGELPCAGSGATCDTGMMGACAVGTENCHMGNLSCDQNQPASAERCDGVDNNCDGMVDNPPVGMSLCGANFVCDRGACVPTCVEGGCFTNQTCVTTTGACVDNACLTVTCPAGQRCTPTGSCVDACAGIVCPIPSVCQSGGCVVPCEGVMCPSGQVCDQGHCQVNCMCRACQDGYGCSIDGTCLPQDCIGLSCAPGQVCRSALLDEPGAVARCVDPCDGAVCPQNQHCESGRCTPGAPPVDAGVDSGMTSDASTSDAHANDTGPADVATDVHASDIVGDGSLGGTAKGCGCSTPGNPSRTTPWGAVVAAAVAVAATRRRRRNTN